ncbi:ABC transporter ATP-binding protein [Fredinandcohnia sp. 179-A 10B2 NHS]|uniref:ABC transporter ATP-binding protein n=1 Tax=Fredinandcohnia sp. 179-A 10B2 NHS TaxID=3235176 RepID=UPI0039A34C98
MSNEVLATDIKISNVYKAFEKVEVLKGIDFTIKKGEFFTLLGPSGCGKTTLLRCIAGFEKVQSGSILFNEKNTTNQQPWEKNVGFVFQNYALWPHMTVFENIAYGLKIQKKDKNYIKEMVDWSLSLVDLKHVVDSYPNQLSGGQQQRVAIARAMVLRPQVLLFDEPLSNLDAKLRIKMRKDIKDIQRKLGISAVYVTHDQEEALEMSDRIAVMNNGVVSQVGTPKEIYENPNDKFVANFVGKSNFLYGEIKDNKFFIDGNKFLPLQNMKSEDTTKTCISFRPENIIVDSISEHALDVEVTDSSYRGNYVQIEVKINENTSFTLETKKEYKVGDRIKIEIGKYILFEE